MGIFNRKKDNSPISDDEKLQNDYFSNVFDEVDKEIESENKERIERENELEKERLEHRRKLEEGEISFKSSEFEGPLEPTEPGSDGKVQFILPNTTGYSLVFDDFEDVTESVYIAKGKVYGEIKANSEAFVYLPNGPFFKTNIKAIYDENMVAQESIKDGRVCIKIDMLGNANALPKFSVVSSNIFVANSMQSITNPLMLAYTYAYKDLYKVKEFSNVFVFTLVHTRFSTPALPVKEGRPGLLMIKNRQDPTKHDIPLFTDINNLSSAERQLKTQQGEKKYAMSIRFNALADGLVQNGDAIVINPFTPAPVVIPNNLIKSITEMDAYKKEFPKKTESNSDDAQ